MLRGYRLLLIMFVCAAQQLTAQQIFTRKDSLHGGLSAGRRAFDIRHYLLDIAFDPVTRHLAGSNTITYKKLTDSPEIQLDLFANMHIDSIKSDAVALAYRRESNALFVDVSKMKRATDSNILKVYYSGNPLAAKTPPWDGGFVYSEDSKGKPWVGVAVQGTGASLWYPCKDSQTDEPEDGAVIRVAVPNGLMNVSNGRFRGSTDLGNGYTRWDWEVRNPINTYNITLNIGDYIHFGEKLDALDLDYYVLRENEAKARVQFEQVKPMLQCFQAKFGPYPFASDGYKLIESAYLGMEHQSAIAYGNGYRNGYLGRDRSGTGVGMLFDYIIIHESGHEWFGNSITSLDIADMWIHEAFTCYSESIYIECLFGKEKGLTYINGLKQNVANDKPIIGQYGVNDNGSTDMYDKGALLMNTLRSVINDDAKWGSMILDFATDFKHSQVDSAAVINFFSEKSGMNLKPIFDQYLSTTQIPVLELRKYKNKLQCRWLAIDGFTMPVELRVGSDFYRPLPGRTWTPTGIPVKNLSQVSVDIDRFYIDVVTFN